MHGKAKEKLSEPKNLLPKFVGFPVPKAYLVKSGYFVSCMGVVCGGCGERHPWNMTMSKN